MHFSFNSLYAIILSVHIPFLSFSGTRLAITEILKDPLGLESAIPGGKSHECIEIFNLGCDTFSLDSIFLSDGSTVDSVIPWTQVLAWHPNCCFNRTVLLPGQFAVVLDRDYAQSPAGSYFTIEDSTVILTVDASSLVGGLTENRGVFLYKGTKSRIVDSLAAMLDTGYRVTLDEKVYHTLPANSAEGFSCIPAQVLLGPVTYTMSPDTLSLGRYEYMQDTWLCEYTLHNPGSYSPTVACSIAVCMAGKERAEHAAWEIIRSDSLSVIGSGTLVSDTFPASLSVNLPKDSITYTFTIEQQNKKATLLLDISSVWLPRSPVKINEIFPRATASVPEWIELVNISSMPVNLKNWRYGTPEGSNNIITSTDFLLNPGRFCVITKSSSEFSAVYAIGISCLQPLSWQSLDNYRDTIFLYNSLEEAPCETTYYDYDWFDDWDNQSVARTATEKSGLSNSAWVLASNPSPGLPNSDVIWQAGDKATMHIGPVPFTPNGDGRDDVLGIRITLPASQRMSVAIYGFNGVKLYDMPQPLQNTMTWDGRTSSGDHAPVGPFFVVGTITKGNKESYLRKKGILWR